MRLAKILFFTVWNVIAVLILLALLNAASFVILKFRPPAPNPTYAGSMDAETRHLLPVYEDREKARRIYEEFYATGIVYESFQGWRRKPFDGQYVSIDEDGSRATPVSAGGLAGTIHFFGGSTMWGTGVADDETIPSAFAALAPEHTVINQGETAYTSRQSLAKLVNLANQDTDMNLVVFYDGYNEVQVQCRRELGLNAHLQEQKIRGTFSSTGPAAVLKKAFYVLTFAYTHKLWNALQEGRNPDRWFHEKDLYLCLEDDYSERIAQALIRNWEMARAIVQQNGGEFLAVLQPTAYSGSPEVDYLEGRIAPEGSPYREQYEKVYRAIREKIREKNAPWIVDLTDAFNGRTNIYLDDCHLGAEGNRIIASRIHDHLFQG